MKVNMNKLGCRKCKYHNENVCNICWKRVYKEFEERKVKKNGESTQRSNQKAETP